MPRSMVIPINPITSIWLTSPFASRSTNSVATMIWPMPASICPPVSSFMPMASSAATMDAQAKPMAIRAPVMVAGAAVGRIIRRNWNNGRAPSVRAALTSRMSILRAAFEAFWMIGKIAA